jgi:hypothetical protein
MVLLRIQYFKQSSGRITVEIALTDLVDFIANDALG